MSGRCVKSVGKSRRFLDTGHALFYTLSFKKTFSRILSGIECID